MSQKDLFSFAEYLPHGHLHMKYDEATGLRAIIAIHSTKLGPALGGCRCISYISTEAALMDAVRLARGMSYKAAITGLPLGGGKSVIIKPHEIPDRKAFFRSFGRFVDSLNGQYITAMDSGTVPSDMDIIGGETPHVTCMSQIDGFELSDPSYFTALGVARGIEAAVKFKLGKDSLKNLHVAIQGVGHVGMRLAEKLYEKGARLTVCDVDEAAVQFCVARYQAKPVSSTEIYQVDCDVFAPCALGAIINDNTLPQLKAVIVAGSANNQLAESRHGKALHDHGILYAPDYVINAGGLIHAVAQYNRTSEAEAAQEMHKIYDNLLEIFVRSKAEGRPTHEIADELAEERLKE